MALIPETWERKGNARPMINATLYTGEKSSFIPALLPILSFISFTSFLEPSVVLILFKYFNASFSLPFRISQRGDSGIKNKETRKIPAGIIPITIIDRHTK